MIVFLSLGANLGNREQTIENAIALLEQHIGPLYRRSAFYYSEPWGFSSDHPFCNLCAAFNTNATPYEILQITQTIETQLGRTTKSTNSVYHDRMIDIDILLIFSEMPNHKWESVCVDSTELKIPHPLMQKRDFVMIPLREILPSTDNSAPGKPTSL